MHNSSTVRRDFEEAVRTVSHCNAFRYFYNERVLTSLLMSIHFPKGYLMTDPNQYNPQNPQQAPQYCGYGSYGRNDYGQRAPQYGTPQSQRSASFFAPTAPLGWSAYDCTIGEAFIRFWKIKIPALQSQVPGFLYCHVNTIIRCHDRISYSKFIFRIPVLQYFDYCESRSEVPPSVSSASAASEASLESDESSFFDLNFSASASLLLRSSSSLASRSAFFGSQRRQSA